MEGDGDTEAGGPSTSSGGQGASDAAERLRQRRRQKILANQGSRLEKILGSDNNRVKPNKEKVEDPPTEDITDGFRSQGYFSGAGSSTRSVSFDESEDVVNIYQRRPTIQVGSHDHAENIDSLFSSTSQGATVRSSLPEASESEQPAQQPAALGFFAPQADGSTIHPKLPSWVCRLLLCILGICLSLFNARYMMVTFFSWEIAVYGINGLHGDDSPSSVLILLVALMGLKEPQLRRLKFALKFSNCIITDVSLFIVFSLIPRIFV